MLTKINPNDTEKTVVNRNKTTVLPPILDNFDTSFRSLTPLIREATIKGIAISLSILMKMVPNGLIQSITHCPIPNATAIEPRPMPATIPINICQCSASFFISAYFILYNTAAR